MFLFTSIIFLQCEFQPLGGPWVTFSGTPGVSIEYPPGVRGGDIGSPVPLLEVEASEEVTLRVTPPDDPPAEPGQSRPLAVSLPSECPRPPFPGLEPSSRTRPWESSAWWRPSGLHTWLDPVKASVQTFKILTLAVGPTHLAVSQSQPYTFRAY